MRALLSLPLVVVGVLGLSSAVPTDGQRWFGHIRFLADDRLEGRDTGSEGHRKAAAYIADHFRQSGLASAGIDGYIQPVKFRSRRVKEEGCSLTLVGPTGREPLVLGDEVVLSMRVEHAPKVSAPLVFVGYGLSIPDANYDDLAGVDLKGKVAVFIGGGPSSVPGPVMAHAQSAGERWQSLKKAGAIGTITIPNPRGMDIPWERSMLSRFMPSMVLADRSLDETEGQQFAATVNPARAEKLFSGSGHTFQELLATANSGTALPHFPLPLSIEGTVAFESSDVESQNVVGVLKGSDPVLKDQYVVLSAHLDHVGVGQPINGDRIYNGAMDNASGVATLLEVADLMHEAGKTYRRSVLFVAVTAEEKGLLGSRYFATHPTVDARSIVADVNMDMFLPLYPMQSVIAQGLEESDLADDLQHVGQTLGIRVLSDPEPERNAFIRSDQVQLHPAGDSLALAEGGVRTQLARGDARQEMAYRALSRAVG